MVSGRQRIALDEECWLDLREGAVPRHEDLLDELIVTTAWEQETITLFGRKMQQPRLTAWFGIGMDSATRYRTTRPALPWPPALRRIIRLTPECPWSLVPLRNGAVHGTRLRPPLVSCGCEVPCMRRAVVLPLLLLLLPTGPLVSERVVVRRRVNPRWVVRQWEISADQGWRVGVVHGLRVALH